MESGNAASEDNKLTTDGLDMTSAQDSSANGVPCGSNVNSDNVNKGNGVSRSTHGVPNIYAQDVVRSNKTNMIGIVTEVAGDMDSDSGVTDDDDDDDEDDDDVDDSEEDGDECIVDEGEDEDGEDEEEDDEDEDGDSEDDENQVEKDDPLEFSNDNHEGNKAGDKNNPLSTEEIRVLWLNATESTENITDVSAIDRGFLHGDYVASSSDPTGQLGVVVDVDISVDLLSPDGSIIENISARDLRRVKDFAIGDYVVLGPWLGRVDDVLDNVTVQVDDGPVCKVTKAEPIRLIPITKNLLEDGNFPYYPGQRVRASSSSVFKRKSGKLEGTVTKVTVGSVFIYWIASAGIGSDSSTAPAEEQTPKNLKLLSCFTYANWQLGDWCLLPSSARPSSVSLEKDMSKLEVDDSSEEVEAMDVDPVATSSRVNKDETWPIHRKRIRKVVVKRDKKSRRKDNFEKALQMTNSRTTVSVLWQDGVIEIRVGSTKIIPVETPGDHDFVAEQYVVEKAVDDEDYAGEPRRVGVVKSVNAKERTACVNWLRIAYRAEDPRKFDKEEIVSVYELEGHPDYDYCYGDVVVRLSPVSTLQIASMNSMEETEKSSGSNKEEDMSCDEGHTNFSDFSWVGNITGLRNGDIEVTWADGMVSTVGPQAIYVVGREDDESLADGSGVSDAASWETVDDDETVARGVEHEEQGMQSADRSSSIEISEQSSGRNSALSLPFAALEFVTRLASGIFSRGQRNLDPEGGNDTQSESTEEEYTQSGGECNSQKAKVLDIMYEEDTSGNGDERVSADGPNSLDEMETVKDLESHDSQASNVDDTSKFKHFDIVSDPIDHYFLGTNAQSNNARKWLKKVHQDWDILQNNLPGEIFVRVYEDRMDVLRAAIVGAYGTPYQDGLFFFDFHLPPEYPDVPPVAYYHSGGWRINPNLYEEGKVCLSLLNTWTGRGNEVWDPSSSSILQVLVSLQGLVLNAKPYFNEAGYDKQVGTAEGEKNSLSYNENTFLLNCKMMMNLMKRLPKDFDELVKEHFQKRGYYILKACDAYKKGYLIGSLAKDASIINEGDANSTSVGFKLMLAKIVPKLLVALEEIGVDCHDFDHLRQL